MDEASRCLRHWHYTLALRATDDPKPGCESTAASSFSTLDGDCVRAVAAAVLILDGTDRCSVSLDRRSRSLLHLSSTSQCTRSALSYICVSMRQQHDARLCELASICMRLGTSLDAVRAARSLFYTPGGSVCAACSDSYPNHHGLCLRTSVPHSQLDAELNDVEDDAEVEDENIVRLISGRCYCALCWRAGFGLSLRPTAEGFEQTWDAPIEDGSWRLVQVATCLTTPMPNAIFS